MLFRSTLSLHDALPISGAQGETGPQGESGVVILTQVEYDALVPDPATLYVISA